MDFNYLYHRQQIALMRADRASCGPSRAAHEELAQLYGGVIEQRRAEQGAGRQDEALNIIAGTRDIIGAARV